MNHPAHFCVIRCRMWEIEADGAEDTGNDRNAASDKQDDKEDKEEREDKEAERRDRRLWDNKLTNNGIVESVVNWIREHDAQGTRTFSIEREASAGSVTLVDERHGGQSITLHFDRAKHAELAALFTLVRDNVPKHFVAA